MKERIKIIRKNAGLTQDEFGKRIGLTRRGTQALESGDSGVSEGTRKLICSEFNVNRLWLETGEGDMHPPVDEFETLIRQAYPNASDRVINFLRRVNEVPDGMEKLLDALDMLLGQNKKPDA